MRGYATFMVIAVIVLLLGAGLLTAAFLPRTTLVSFDVRPGSYFGRFQVDVISGGTIAVSFQVVSGGPVTIYVMTEAQHTVLLTTGVVSSIASQEGTSGAFSATLPSGGTYFVETGHGSTDQSSDQIGTKQVTVNAVGTTLFVAGFAVILVGVVLVGIAAWWKKRPDRPRAFGAPPPYVPGAYAGPPWPGPPGTVPGVPPGPAGTAAPASGMLVVTIENRTASEETVQILVNGVGRTSLTMAPGTASQAILRSDLAGPAGSTVKVEVVAADGRRAAQDVFVAPWANTPVNLRIG